MSYVWHCGGNGGYGDVFPGGAADNVILGQFNNEPMFGNRPPAQFVEVITDSMNCLQLTNAMPPSGFTEGPNQSGGGYWIDNSPRMFHMEMQSQDGPGPFSINNWEHSGDRFGSSREFEPKYSDTHVSGDKINDENNKGQSNHKKTMKQMKADKRASYVGVPTVVLYCHVCSKHMWDPECFKKHLCGRPHKLMMTYLDEAYRMHANLMRHQIKAIEKLREIDLIRDTSYKQKLNQKNLAKPNYFKPLVRSYCTMCDVFFCGPFIGHRKSDWHMKLKQFLHTECKLCNVFFYSRLDMDEHKLTAGHLMKVAEMRIINHPHLKNDEFDLIDVIRIKEEEKDDYDHIPVANKYEMLRDRDSHKVMLELELEGLLEKDYLADETDKTAVTGHKNVDEIDVEKNESEVEFSNTEIIVEDSTIIELNKDEISKNKQTVAYDPNVAIGKEFLVPFKGYVCKLCDCLLLDQQLISVHCQTSAHYMNHTAMVKMKEATSEGKIRSFNEVDKNRVVTSENTVKKINNGRFS